jgi:hypothetical protein
MYEALMPARSYVNRHHTKDGAQGGLSFACKGVQQTSSFKVCDSNQLRPMLLQILDQRRMKSMPPEPRKKIKGAGQLALLWFLARSRLPFRIFLFFDL